MSSPNNLQLHLDPVGGVAGDMFIAAIVDTFPHLSEGLLQAIRSAGVPAEVNCHLVTHRDGVLAGKRFLVDMPARRDAAHGEHVTFARIRELLTQSDLSSDVRHHAIGIFTELARAESEVHGIPVEEVSFHEVGALDSIADIAGAAYLIDALRATRWSVGPLPTGSGQVRTAHGVLPVPAPATALLLKGFLTYDDGRMGERVTPTGAAILRYVGCVAASCSAPRRLVATGVGFGLKDFPGISNCLRVLAYSASEAVETREVALIEFEIDDQSGEELALGLERLRGLAGVLDVVQMPAFGKKGRMVAHVQVLAEPAQLQSVVAACFEETTTIGLRYQTVRRAELDRSSEKLELEGRSMRVKLVRRASLSYTAKTEMDTLANVDGGHAERARLKRAAEEEVLRRPKELG